VKVHLALGYFDMRKGIDGLAILVQGVHARTAAPGSC
jgi:transposase